MKNIALLLAIAIGSTATFIPVKRQAATGDPTTACLGFLTSIQGCLATPTDPTTGCAAALTGIPSECLGLLTGAGGPLPALPLPGLLGAGGAGGAGASGR